MRATYGLSAGSTDALPRFQCHGAGLSLLPPGVEAMTTGWSVREPP